ncbi:MAG: hypothetical protein WCP30_05705 [Mycobacteriaceae bacterium]
MRAYRTGLVGVALVIAGLATDPVAHADVAAPDVGSACTAELDGAMTLLPDETTYVSCQPQFGADYAWVAVQTPFPPNDSWLSYGPAITLHGQGMRNPNLSSGPWTARPQDPETTCRVTQTTVVEAGVLAAQEVSEGEPGKPLTVQMQPKLFYAELAGACLWVRD